MEVGPSPTGTGTLLTLILGNTVGVAAFTMVISRLQGNLDRYDACRGLAVITTRNCRAFASSP